MSHTIELPAAHRLLSMTLSSLLVLTACTRSRPAVSELTIRDSIESYRAAKAEELDANRWAARAGVAEMERAASHRSAWHDAPVSSSAAEFTAPYFTLGVSPIQAAIPRPDWNSDGSVIEAAGAFAVIARMSGVVLSHRRATLARY